MKITSISVLAFTGISTALKLVVYQSSDCSGIGIHGGSLLTGGTKIAHRGTCVDNRGGHSFRYMFQGDTTKTVKTFVYPQSCDKHTGETATYMSSNQCTQCSPGWSECVTVNTGSAWVATYAVPQD